MKLLKQAKCPPIGGSLVKNLSNIQRCIMQLLKMEVTVYTDINDIYGM